MLHLKIVKLKNLGDFRELNSKKGLIVFRQIEKKY